MVEMKGSWLYCQIKQINNEVKRIYNFNLALKIAQNKLK